MASVIEWGAELASPPAQAAGSPAACYRELSRFPAVTRAALGAPAGGQTFLLYTECSRPDLSRRRLLRFSRHYSLWHTGDGGITVSRAALSAEIHHQLLSQDSPSGQHRAVLSRCPRQGHELLEVWGTSGRSHSVDLTALGKHGEVYTEGAIWLAEEDNNEEEEQFLYREDWGEMLTTRSVPVLCTLDMEGSSISVLEGIPEHLSPGQTRQIVTVLDVVQEPTEAFTGLYRETLPPRCWAADSRRVVLGTPQRSRTDLLLVDTETATVTNLTAGSPEGCWELLTLQWDLLVATCSAPHRPHNLVVAVLPPAGQELPLRWVPVEDTPMVPGVTWKTLTVQPPCTAKPFEALLLSPSDSTVPHPLVVCPHGGPHAVFDARWRPGMAALCQLGFAVLLVNYRGSLGFGQASINSLISRVGEQDVADTQLAVEQVLRNEPLDPHRLALLAGSHGAFIALHLLTREPKRYRACALRSPVSNLPALLGTSDIPDWRYTSLGLPYSFERVPCTEDMAAMLLRSPIAQAAQVRTLVLLCVGARDRRVSPTQALELYRVLRARGVPARLLWYPEGGHALTGVETEANVFRNCARWFLLHLGQPQQGGTGQHSP